MHGDCDRWNELWKSPLRFSLVIVGHFDILLYHQYTAEKRTGCIKTVDISCNRLVTTISRYQDAFVWLAIAC